MIWEQRPWVLGGVGGQAGVEGQPSWFVSFVTGGRAGSVGTDAGSLFELVMERWASSILIDSQRQGHLLRKRRKAGMI